MNSTTPATQVGRGLRFMQTLSVVLNYPSVLLRGRAGVFKPLERAVLDAITNRLDEPASSIARSQLAQINYVQRATTRRTECNFYRFVPFHVELARDRKFEFADPNVLLATLRFQSSSGSRQVVKVYVALGCLFSLEFGGDMRRHFSEIVSSVIEFRQHTRIEG